MKPYTYLIGWTSLNLVYYGRRTSRKIAENELWTTYFTSSRHVQRLRREFGEPDIVQVRKRFETPSECRIWETKVLRRLDARNHPKMLNRRNGDDSDLFNTSDTALAKDPATNRRIGPVLIDDPRWRTGEIVHILKGIKQTEEHKRKLGLTRKNTVVIFDHEQGRNRRISRDDPLYKSGRFVAASRGRLRGRKQSREHIQKRTTSRLSPAPCCQDS